MKIINKKKENTPNGIKETVEILGIPFLKKFRTSWGKKTYLLGIKISDKQIDSAQLIHDLTNKMYTLELVTKSLEASLRDMNQFEKKLKAKFPELDK